jgi:serine/threonine protein kinase
MLLDPRHVKALFNAALDLPAAADRAAFLDRECGDNKGLRQRLGDLLAAYDQPAGALERPLAEDLGQTTARDGGAIPAEQPALTSPEAAASSDQTGGYRLVTLPPAALIGSVIAGRYKLREEIGEGGMGSVYLAEQLQPVKRQVALKLIKAGMDSTTVLARFGSERQALALMDHPHIAKVLDAGTTDTGRPFFVMELVKGIPLTDYCDQHRLGLMERLTLFREICSAVQHAHQKGIIHRDLKPTNILVESHDGHPVPKVIDFGLAKATSGLRLNEHSLYSAFGTVAGTPLYMAPEQASINALDVDTRADVYSLGVILYELLTGSTPIQRETFRRAALDEMLRLIREVEPPTPSSRISTSDTLASLAATRHIEPARLGRYVRGELDWIVMKALAKERQRRYESPIAFAQDIDRFLTHEPISAGPPTASYRFKKFVRRNRAQVIAASLLLVALVGGIVGTTFGLIEANRQKRIAVAAAVALDHALRAESVQRQRADAQRQQAEKRLTQIEKADDILGSIFKYLNPKEAEKEGKPLLALLAERLDQATTQIEGEAIGDPLTVARIQRTLGESHLALGNPEKAIGLLTKARATFAARFGPDHLDTFTSMADLAGGYKAAGKLDEALPLFQQTLALMKAKLGVDHPLTLTTMSNLAASYTAAGQRVKALPLLAESLALVKAKLGPDHSDTLACMSNLATGYFSVGDLDRALPLYEQTLGLMQAKFGPDSFDTVTLMNNVAAIYQATGKLDRALPLYEQALALRKAKLGAEHPATHCSMSNLAVGYLATGNFARALPLFEETFALTKAKLGPNHPDTLTCMNNLAKAYKGAGKMDRALPLYEETLALMKTKLGPDHSDTLTSVNSLAMCYQAAGKPDRALSLRRELANVWKRVAGADSLQYSAALVTFGLNLLHEKHWAEAEAVVREALTIYEHRESDNWRMFNTKALLGEALLGQQKYSEAESLLKAGYEGMKQRAETVPPEDEVCLTEALDRLIELAEATGKVEEAKMWSVEKAKMPGTSTPKPDTQKK